MNDKDPVFLVEFDDRSCGGSSGSFNDFDPFGNDDFGVFFVRRGRDRREESQVDSTDLRGYSLSLVSATNLKDRGGGGKRGLTKVCL